MKTKFIAWLAGVGVLYVAATSAPVLAQTAGRGAETSAQQLTAERVALQEMFNDPNVPDEKKAMIKTLLVWNTRGVAISEFKKMQAQQAPAPQAIQRMPAEDPAPATVDVPNNLAEAEAAPPPLNPNAAGGNMLQNFSKGREAEASARTAASLGLVKVQQDMDNAARDSEAKLRDAQNIRNQAGASALAQRQQDAASAASQQAAGSIGNMLSESLVQSVQQGAQAAGQSIGGGAVGRMGGVVGSGSSGGGGGDIAGGAMAAGANAAAGQIFGGGAPAVPATGGGSVPAEFLPAAIPATPAAAEANQDAAMALSTGKVAERRAIPGNQQNTTVDKKIRPQQTEFIRVMSTPQTRQQTEYIRVMNTQSSKERMPEYMDRRPSDYREKKELNPALMDRRPSDYREK